MLNVSSCRFRSALFLSAFLILAPLQLFANEANEANEAETTPSGPKKCLYVSSYHSGDSWSDAIGRSIRESLTDVCEVRQIDMDAKRRNLPEQIFEATNSVIQVIEEWQPDIVITSDDIAAKHVIAPHYKDTEIPFVFSGINWTVDEYGFPFSNVTGIVEVAPVRTMLEEAIKLSGQGHNAVYIAPNTLSEKKNFERIQLEAATLNVQIDAKYISHFKLWKDALESSSEYDFIVMGGSADIKGWSDSEAVTAAIVLNTKISVTNQKEMMKYTTFGFTNLPSEQGEWAGDVAARILNGTPIANIPIDSNKKWDLWVNELVLEHLNIKPPRNLMRKAKRFDAGT